MNYNHITLVGTVSTLKATKIADSYKTVITISIDRPYRKDDGSCESDLITCVLWGKLAEVAEKYLDKGKNILVEGRFQVEDQSTFVLLENFQLLEK